MTKKCSRCKQIKSSDEFHKNPTSKDGLNWYCVDCEKEYRKIHIETARQYRRKNWEKCKIACWKWQTKYPEKAWANRTRCNHNKIGIPVSLTTIEIADKLKKNPFCALCGQKLQPQNGKGGMADCSPTLDRKNNEKFLNKDNALILCAYCNRAKGNRTLKEFIEYCRKIGQLNLADFDKQKEPK